MRALLKLLPLILLVPTIVSAQDPQVRSEAVELMELATAASVAAKLPNVERIDTFRVLDAPKGAREGKFTRIVVQGVGKREESSLGDYHFVQIWANGQIAAIGSQEIAPPEIDTVYHLTPI